LPVHRDPHISAGYNFIKRGIADSRLIIPIQRSKIVKILAGIVLVLIAFHGLVLYLIFVLKRDYVLGFVPLFHMDIEADIPTHFSSILLLIIAYLLFCVSRHARAAGSRYSTQWSLLSLIAIGLSIDEISTIHEKTILPLRGAFDLSGPFYYSWVILGIAGIALIAIPYRRMVFDLPAGFRSGLIAAVLIYLAGVLGFELMGGNYASIHGTENFTYQLFVAFEELLEMARLILMINTLLKHLDANQIRIEHVFEQ
jgi:hypothetical protein